MNGCVYVAMCVHVHQQTNGNKMNGCTVVHVYMYENLMDQCQQLMTFTKVWENRMMYECMN